MGIPVVKMTQIIITLVGRMLMTLVRRPASNLMLGAVFRAGLPMLDVGLPTHVSTFTRAVYKTMWSYQPLDGNRVKKKTPELWKSWSFVF
jgi:hypothetical protein